MPRKKESFCYPKNFRVDKNTQKMIDELMEKYSLRYESDVFRKAIEFLYNNKK